MPTIAAGNPIPVQRSTRLPANVGTAVPPGQTDTTQGPINLADRVPTGVDAYGRTTGQAVAQRASAFVVPQASYPGPATGRTVGMTWTAPGDDGNVGQAASYDLRVSNQPITDANFASAAQVTGMPAPAPAGTREQLQVNNVPPGTLYLALKTTDDAGNTSGLSNVLVLPDGTTDVGPSARGETSLSRPWPNPARQNTHFLLTLENPAHVRMDVFDAQGRSMRNLMDADMPAGKQQVDWDLRDGQGSRLPAGMYFVRGQLGDQSVVQRVVITP